MSFQAVEAVMKYSQHKGSAKLVLVSIAYHANKDSGEAWPSLETIANECNCTDRYVRDILPKLVESGELEMTYKAGPNGTNLYRILLTSPAPDPEPEFQVNGHNKQEEIEPTRNHSSSTPGTMVPSTRNHSSPEPKRTAKNLNNNGVDKNSTPKKTRKPSAYSLACGELSQEFIRVTGIQLPNRAKDKDFWFGSCGELYAIANKDVDIGKKLIAYTVEKMDAENMTISEPNSIVKTARAVMAKRANQKNGFNSQVRLSAK